MRSYKTLILEAELLASSPERVHQWLEDRAAKATRQIYDDLDVAAEKALLKRGDALIDLALARFSGQSDVAIELFNRAPVSGGESTTPIRLAILSNQMLGRAFSVLGSHGGLFANEKAAVDWLGKAAPTEIAALFQNPTINDSFLRDFLEGKGPWKALAEDGRLTAVFALSKNPRISQEYDGWMDGWAEYSHNAVFDAAWKLAETVPTTAIWANALWELFNGLKREASSLDNPLEVAKRWTTPTSDEGAQQSEKSSNDVGHLDAFQSVRAALARLRLSDTRGSGNALLKSEDVAFRVAAYSDMELTPEQVLASYGRDKLLAQNYLVHNEKLWQSPKVREALHDISWQATKDDKHSDLMAANIFNSAKEAMQKKHPEWFADEDEDSRAPELPPELSNEPATKADVHRVLEAVGVRAEGGEPVLAVIKQLNASILGLGKTLGWVWWFSLGAFVSLLWRR